MESAENMHNLFPRSPNLAAETAFTINNQTINSKYGRNLE